MDWWEGLVGGTGGLVGGAGLLWGGLGGGTPYSSFVGNPQRTSCTSMPLFPDTSLCSSFFPVTIFGLLPQPQFPHLGSGYSSLCYPDKDRLSTT